MEWKKEGTGKKPVNLTNHESPTLIYFAALLLEQQAQRWIGKRDERCVYVYVCVRVLRREKKKKKRECKEGKRVMKYKQRQEWHERENGEEWRGSAEEKSASVVSTVSEDDKCV